MDGSFVWYELMTTDTAAAATFYANVVGWGAQDASTPDLAYTLFTAGSGAGVSLPTSATGQKRKSSMRAYVFRCSPNNGHRQDTSAGPFRANKRHRSRMAAQSAGIVN
jgi:hypothetical protein